MSKNSLNHYLPLKIRRPKMTPSVLRIAVIIRTKNRPYLLARSLQSLIEQTRLPDEVIVVNDGGVPVDQVVQPFADLNIQRIDNVTSYGRARAGNLGVQASQSTAICFLDDDDRFLPDHLQRLEKAMLLFDTPVIYSGCQLVQRDVLGEETIVREKIIGQFNEPYDAKRLSYENYIPLINLLIDRNLWLKIGGFDESFDIFEDWDVLKRLSAQTSFYHLNRITTEYAIWGVGQITQSADTARWTQAYHQFLEKHVMPLPYAEKLKLLGNYWVISQQRRGFVQESRTENHALQVQLLEKQQALLAKQQELEQLQHALYQEIATTQTHNQDLKKQIAEAQTQYNTLHNELTERDHKYTNEYGKLHQTLVETQQQCQRQLAEMNQQLIEARQQHQQQLTTVEQQYQQQLAEVEQQQAEEKRLYDQQIVEANGQHDQALAKVEREYQQKLTETFQLLTEVRERYSEQYTGLETQYTQLKATVTTQHQQYLTLQDTLHEISKKIAVGMDMSKTVIERHHLSQPPAYLLGRVSGNVIDDYHRLVNWVRSEVEQVIELEQQLAIETQPLHSIYRGLQNQLTYLIELISASHWPQIRRYANAVKAIDEKVTELFNHAEHYFITSAKVINQLGLRAIRKDWELSPTDALPLPRPLSTVYPTFVTIAGTSEQAQFMESVMEWGTTPFLLVPTAALVFTTYCSQDHFFRIDLLLGNCLRINLCHLRVIIRESNSAVVIRKVYIDTIEILDNRFHPIYFEAIADSAGKTYQIEIDSPDASMQSAIAVWCHVKQPVISCSMLPIENVPTVLPQWAQRSLLEISLSSALTVTTPTHLLFIGGIEPTTTALDLHLLLNQFSKVLEYAHSTAQVVILGQGQLQHYCQQHQLIQLDSLDFPTMLEWAKTESQAEVIWFCELGALPSTDIIDRVTNLLASEPETAMLVPMEQLADETIRAGYALMMREGVINFFPIGAPTDHPYHRYRRTVDASSSALIMIRRNGLLNLDFDKINAYQTLNYQLAELIWQLKQKHYKTVYDAALCYQRSQSPSPIDYPLLEQDRAHFSQRWHEQLPHHLPIFTDLNILLNLQRQPTVLVIDATLPTYDEDSGSLRIYTLLKIWVSLGYHIVFLPDNLDSNFKYRHALEALGIEVFHGRYGIQDALAYRTFQFALICRVDIGHRYIPFVRLLSPQTVIFYDTVDIHYIREQRQAEIENNLELRQHAQTTKRKELSNCLLANRVITVTEEDGRHLQQELPHLQFSVIPNIHPLQTAPKSYPFEQREGLVFIGNYNHQPNEDAIYYFIEHVLPKIVHCLPDIKFYVVGSNMKEAMKNLSHDSVKMVGWVDEVEPVFAQRRVFACYLRYGAGMKGKLGQALSLGLPIVTTSIGAEGMGLIEGETALIADDPETFATAIYCLYTDADLWEKLSRQGREYIEQRFGENAVRHQLQELLESKFSE
ncbi:MAG: hypothetical protein BWK79_09065 [Beggiatoa sp. IS2]|nr:MAG: hypothetical protein BWK79_09065 [Beggiatoa sp. IS2]